jgi:putative transposase
MKERMRFVTDRERGPYSMVELCARYDVSRKTGYKWLARYEGDGVDGLRARSRAPHQCPHRIAAEVAEAICAGRRQHPGWGPDKILHWLKRRHPRMDLPATSTAGDLLARRGLVKRRRRRRHYTHPGVVPATTTQYTGTLPPIEYPGHYIPKRVTNAGTIRFKKRLLFIANSLKQQVLGLEEAGDGVWSIYFCRVLLARVDERDYVLRP